LQPEAFNLSPLIQNNQRRNYPRNPTGQRQQENDENGTAAFVDYRKWWKDDRQDDTEE